MKKRNRPLKRKQDLGKASWSSFYIVLDKDGKPLTQVNKETNKKNPMLFSKQNLQKVKLELPKGFRIIRADKLIKYYKNKGD